VVHGSSRQDAGTTFWKTIWNLKIPMLVKCSSGKHAMIFCLPKLIY